MPNERDSDGLPHIDEIATASLADRGPLAEARAQQIREHEAEHEVEHEAEHEVEHEAEHNRRHTLALAVWHAVIALDQRLRDTPDVRLRATLEHNRTEMLRWHECLDAELLKHERAIEALEQQQ